MLNGGCGGRGVGDGLSMVGGAMHMHSTCTSSNAPQGAPLVTPGCQALLDNTPEFDYLTHIVFRRAR